MATLITLVSIWAVLMIRSAYIEYQYYQAVKTFEPEIWKQLNAPKFLPLPFFFVSKEASKCLKDVKNQQVCLLAKKHFWASRLFLGYLVVVLFVGIIFFKLS